MMHRRLQLALIALVLAVQGLWAARAQAQPTPARVEKGISEFQDLEFAAAIATLEPVLELGDASQSEKLLALELIAISYLSLGNVPESRRAFARLLKLDRDYQLRNHDGSPKVESLFESVRAGMPAQEDPADEDPDPVDTEGPEPPALLRGPSKDARAGRRYEMFVVSEGEGIKELVLFWRPRPSGSFQSKAMRRSKGKWRVKLALPSSKVDYQLQYYVVGKGVAGQTLAELGSATSPLEQEVAADSALVGGGGKNNSAWYTSWPVWAGVGAVVVGGSIYALSSGSDPRQGALSPGRITLTP